MWSLIFKPLKPHLAGRTTLFVAPDGNINLLPFEALPLSDNRTVIEDYHIRYLTVGRDLLSFNQREMQQRNAPLVVANPDFNLGLDSVPMQTDDLQSDGRVSRDMDRGSFSELSSTEIEGKQIAALLSVTPLLKEKVLKADIIRSDSPSILHIATHGFFLKDNPRQPFSGRLGQFEAQAGENPLLRSGLVLAGVNAWNEGKKLPPDAGNGILTADEIIEMNLMATELVVLSACETALGIVQNGEGVFGLRRAFVLAGARTLLMSLWKVDDEWTMRLMTCFYKRLMEGQACAEALRSAQLAIKAQKPHPYFWSPFICQGDPSALSQYQRTTQI